MLTSSAIHGLIRDSTSSMAVGKARLHAQRENRPGSGTTQRQQQFLDAMTGLKYPAVESYAHPAATAGRDAKLGARGDGPLTPTEHAWLARLPDDPTEMTDDQTSTLAALTDLVTPAKNPMDAKLLDTYWQPVKAIHDKNAAAAAARNAGKALPPIPSSALGALADAIAAENPTLTAQEAMGRAQDKLAEAVSARNARRQQTLAAGAR